MAVTQDELEELEVGAALTAASADMRAPRIWCWLGFEQIKGKFGKLLQFWSSSCSVLLSLGSNVQIVLDGNCKMWKEECGRRMTEILAPSDAIEHSLRVLDPGTLGECPAESHDFYDITAIIG